MAHLAADAFARDRIAVGETTITPALGLPVIPEDPCRDVGCWVELWWVGAAAMTDEWPVILVGPAGGEQHDRQRVRRRKPARPARTVSARSTGCVSSGL